MRNVLGNSASLPGLKGKTYASSAVIAKFSVLLHLSILSKHNFASRSFNCQPIACRKARLFVFELPILFDKVILSSKNVNSRRQLARGPISGSHSISRTDFLFESMEFASSRRLASRSSVSRTVRRSLTSSMMRVRDQGSCFRAALTS